MKKFIAVLLILTMVMILPACNKNTGNVQQIKQEGSKSEESYKFKDDDYYTQLAENIDICFLEPELIFADASQISQKDLYLFFCFIVSSENLYNDGNDWRDEANSVFRVPVSLIEPLLKKYLEIDSFDPVKAFGEEKQKYEGIPVECGYNKDKDEYVTPVFAGFGGARFTKLLEKKYLGDNVVEITVGFYDEDHNEMYYKKVLKIKENPGNDKEYKLLAITKIEN